VSGTSHNTGENSGTERLSGRVLGLDYGSKTIGVAVSDPTGTVVQPVETIQRTNHRTDVHHVKRFAAQFEVGEIVIGHPVHMSGERGESAEAVEEFAGRVRAKLQVPVHLMDERLTTVEAHERLEAAGVKYDKRKEMIDQVAAMVILEEWLRERERWREESAR
jgi:putative Holliday junction resolvase